MLKCTLKEIIICYEAYVRALLIEQSRYDLHLVKLLKKRAWRSDIHIIMHYMYAA